MGKFCFIASAAAELWMFSELLDSNRWSCSHRVMAPGAQTKQDE